MSEKVNIETDLEMIKWAGLSFEGEEIPIQLQRLMWAVRMQGMRVAWRDMYQIAAAQVENYSVRLPVAPPDATSSESVTQSDGVPDALEKSDTN